MKYKIMLILMVFNAEGYTQTAFCVAGNKYMEQRRYQKAARSYKECNSDSTDFRNEIAFCYAKLGRLQQAKGIYKELLLEKKDPETLGKMAQLQEQEGDYNLAINSYETILKID